MKAYSSRLFFFFFFDLFTFLNFTISYPRCGRQSLISLEDTFLGSYFLEEVGHLGEVACT